MRAIERWANASVWLVCAGALAAASRALLWPRAAGDAVLVGLPRAAILLAVGATLAGAVAAVGSWRRSRRTALDAARRIDAHLGLPDVVASAHAFESAHTPGPAAALARARAVDALEAYDPKAAVPRPRLRPRLRRVALGALAIGLGLGAGTLDARVVTALVSPPTPEELAAARELDALARQLEAAEPNEPAAREDGAARGEDAEGGERAGAEGRPASDRALAAEARRAAEATRQGDRSAALRALRRIAEQRRREAARARRRERTLSQVAAALGAPRPAGRASSPGRSRPSERARELSRLLRRRERQQRGEQNAEAEERRTLERLTRNEDAEAAARAAAREHQRTYERLARAADRAQRRGDEALSELLRRAASAVNEHRLGDAADAMQQVARALERREGDAGEARTAMLRRAALARSAAETERALQRARMGRRGDQDADATMAGEPGQGDRPGGQGEPGGQGRQLSASILNRLTALGLARGPGTGSGTQGGGANPRRGRAREGLDAQREVHARSQVREGVGERAVAALEGLGSDGEPTTEYRDVFPSYGVQVEEALGDEHIPAARRRTVRRYFESIRPDDPASTAEEPR